MSCGAGRARRSSGPSARLGVASALTLVALAGPHAHGTALTSRVVRAIPMASDSLIVGRAVCGGRVWLLNEHLDLTEIATATLTAATRAVSGFRRDDRPWGLACTAEQRIWTLPGARSLARITSGGRVVDRRPLDVPSTALFGAGDRLLLAPAPPIVGIPLLASSLPDRPHDRRAWPGLLGRASVARVNLLARNLVACGIGFNRDLPCWLADSTEIIVSDGAQVRRLALSFVTGEGVDREAPIRDVALVGPDRVWALTTSARLVNGRRAGRRLFLAANGHQIAALDLPSNVRLIIAADQSTCVLLTVDGRLIEVNAR